MPISKDFENFYELADKISRDTADRRDGIFKSLENQKSEARFRSILGRTDSTAREVTEHVLLFLRAIFAHNKDLTWRGLNGLSDVSTSDIIIESVFSLAGRDVDYTKPSLSITPGQTTTNSIVLGDVRHFNSLSGVTTRTGLTPGTIQILVREASYAAALDLAELIRKILLADKSKLLKNVLHDIGNISVGGSDGGNSIIGTSTPDQISAIVPVSFSYFYQWTSRVSPREGAYILFNKAVVSSNEENTAKVVYAIPKIRDKK